MFWNSSSPVVGQLPLSVSFLSDFLFSSSSSSSFVSDIIRLGLYIWLYSSAKDLTERVNITYKSIIICRQNVNFSWDIWSLKPITKAIAAIVSTDETISSLKAAQQVQVPALNSALAAASMASHYRPLKYSKRLYARTVTMPSTALLKLLPIGTLTFSHSTTHLFLARKPLAYTQAP